MLISCQFDLLISSEVRLLILTFCLMTLQYCIKLYIASIALYNNSLNVTLILKR